ncbi:hypothetical protein [Candidatus Tisiphia endosymbiont of Oplodontha viridula]|uniref:hypothetical protein n=1 Tax=Candidatus Tisiphia endosymbiont of Oplodontha viridula TaxID=3077925 RepID=UPI0035C8E966
MVKFKMTNNYKITFKNFCYVSCCLLRLSVALLPFWYLTSLAVYTEPTANTNVNKVDPLFNERIANYKGFEQVLERQKASAVKGAESEAGFNDLVGSRQARTKGTELSNIRAEELEGFGIRESFKEAWINEYLVDYSKPGMIRHKDDASKITEATGQMMSSLLGFLKRLDIDCKQVKGNKEIEPQYYIQLIKELDRDKGDTVYDKTICEELRNKYHCTDTVTVRCINRTRGELKPGTIRFGHHEMPDHWWIGTSQNGERCYGGIQNTTDEIALFDNTPELLAEVKQKIAEKIGNTDIEVPDQEIMFFQGSDGVSLDGINSSGRVVLYQLDQAGNKGYVQNTWHPTPEPVSGSVRFFYRVAQEERCIEWREEWNEICRLQ